METATVNLNKPSITYDGRSVVTATYYVQPGDDFDDALAACLGAVGKFDRSKPGSTWGCDGVGYFAQKREGRICVHNSGVGPRKYSQGRLAV